MNYKTHIAALLFAGFAFAAQPVCAQGYSGVLPSGKADSSDQGALPFMSTQMGKSAGGGHSDVTGGDQGDEQADANDQSDEQTDDVAAAEDLDGDGQPDAPDISDIYGLNGDTTLSTDEQNQPAGKSGYMAMIGGEDKPADQFDAGDAETPADLYRAMEGAGTLQSELEKKRLRQNRQLEAARAAHDREIDAMNAARMRDNQIRAQAEIDRVTNIQKEAMAIVRERQGTATEEDYEVLNNRDPDQEQQSYDGGYTAEDDSGLSADDTGDNAE